MVLQFAGGNAKSSCSRSVKKLKLPPHTKFAKSQKNARETKILCDKGYFFSKGKSEAVIKCRKGVIAKPIPACRGKCWANLKYYEINEAT